jgi:hypothetical protein
MFNDDLLFDEMLAEVASNRADLRQGHSVSLVPANVSALRAQGDLHRYPGTRTESGSDRVIRKPERVRAGRGKFGTSLGPFKNRLPQRQSSQRRRVTHQALSSSPLPMELTSQLMASLWGAPLPP